MKTIIPLLGLCVGTLLATPSSAALIDHGAAGDYFYDTNSGLYWFDPAHFVGQTRAEMDLFAATSKDWDWATSDEIEALEQQSTVGGVSLESVMGARQYTLGGGGPRWLGYYAETGQPDGWIAQAADTTDTISSAGFQFDAASFPGTVGVGGWMVSRVDPVPEPTTITLAALGLLGLGVRGRRGQRAR